MAVGFARVGRRRCARVAALVSLCVTAPWQAPAEAQSEARRISVTWTEAPVADVLHAFAAFSGFSIVAGSGVGGFVTADINDQPWDVALEAVLASRGLAAIEDEHGIIRVESLASMDARETLEPLLTRSYRVSYSRAAEIQTAIAGVLSPRGRVSVVESTNTLVVTDVARVQRSIAALLRD